MRAGDKPLDEKLVFPHSVQCGYQTIITFEGAISPNSLAESKSDYPKMWTRQ